MSAEEPIGRWRGAVRALARGRTHSHSASSSAPGDQLTRLPQDVALDHDLARAPDLPTLTGSVDQHARNHEAALSTGDFSARVTACWGLVSRGQDSLGWVMRGLEQQNESRIEDAAGVLQWIGTPPAMIPVLRELLESMPDGQAADAVAAALERAAGPEVETTPTSPTEELYGGLLAAFTSTIWFIQAPYGSVAEEAVGKRDGWTSTPVKDRPLEGMLGMLEPWSMPSWKQILVPTSSNWTAIFSQGSDLNMPRGIGRSLGCRMLRTSYEPRVIRDGKTVSHGGCAFWFEDYGNGTSRTIQASFQSRWEWYLEGDPLPFENAEAYSAKRIPDRFTLERMNTYCAALGIRRNESAFYLPGGLLIEQDTSSWTGRTRQLSSAYWRAQNR